LNKKVSKNKCIKYVLFSPCAKTYAFDEKSPDSRLAKSEKTQFTNVNEYFSDKHYKETGVFVQKIFKE